MLRKWEYNDYYETIAIVNEETDEVLIMVDKGDITGFNQWLNEVDFFAEEGDIWYDNIYCVDVSQDGADFMKEWCELEGYSEEMPTHAGRWYYSKDEGRWKEFR